MAGGTAALGDRFPGRVGSVEQQVTALRGYVYMLLENLRYILTNLDPSNFSESGLAELGELVAETVRAGLVISDAVITEELCAEYGDIAALTVNSLRTDYLRAQRYLLGDTSQLDYIYAHDGEINFITGTTDGLSTEQLVRGGVSYWWADAEHSRMTVEPGGEPVICYKYQELVKLTLRFEAMAMSNGTATVMPVIVLGAGTGIGDRGKAFIYKDSEGLVIRQVTGSGEYTEVTLGDYVDAKHRRLASCEIDRTSGVVSYMYEGETATHTLLCTEGENSVTYTWPDGFTTEVSVV